MSRWTIEGNEQDLAKLLELIRKSGGTEVEADKVTVLKVDPQKGIKEANPEDPEVLHIMDSDEETVFELESHDLYLSCRESDLILVGSSVYLPDTAVVYRLDEEDALCPMTEEDEKAAEEIITEKIHLMRLQGYQFYVLDLSEDGEEDD